MANYPSTYWDQLYDQNLLGWDVGNISTPLKTYFDQLSDKSLRILVPGAGNGWEVEYLYRNGFTNTFMLDFSKSATNRFKQRFPAFPTHHIFTEDFFEHQQTYDLLIEQTFFSSLPISFRKAYANQVFQLLTDGGKLTGLLFNHEFPQNGPPFGGSAREYRDLFSSQFKLDTFETAHNSIKPRRGREIFIIARKKELI